MKAWLKGGLIGIGIFVIGLLALFLDSGATTIFDYIYNFIFFLIYFFRILMPGELVGDFIGLFASLIFWFLIGALIGFIHSKFKERKK